MIGNTQAVTVEQILSVMAAAPDQSTHARYAQLKAQRAKLRDSEYPPMPSPMRDLNHMIQDWENLKETV